MVFILNLKNMDCTEIISGEKIQEICDAYCGNRADLQRNPRIFKQSQKHILIESINESWDNPPLIFCYSNAITFLINNLHFITNPFILVTHNEDTNITPISPYSFIYGKYESHSIDLYDTKNHDSPLYGQIRLTLIYYLLKGAKLYGGCGLDLNGMIVKGDLLAFFALHNRTESAIIYTKSLDWGTFSWDQPFEHIKDYFGEKIALFYHFLGHYSYWLIIPAAIGFIFQLIVLSVCLHI
jgi:hypothetical protein